MLHEQGDHWQDYVRYENATKRKKLLPIILIFQVKTCIDDITNILIFQEKNITYNTNISSKNMHMYKA